jgi:DNA (cytosine-5)-methyltransferase 1
LTRPPQIRAAFEGELVVDNFAGGGGASTGIEAALGRPVDIAINHSPEAIAMHRANHPETKHFLENILEVDPRAACGSRPVGLAWFSPDCTHFSRAKGTTPLKKEIRGLAWVVIRWAREVAPRVIVLENVEEFQTWGPLGDDNRPDPARAGETFRAWVGALSDLGYSIEFRTLVAADYGAPTTRRRLFMIARRDGGPVVWPDATHGRDRGSAWRPASEIIDWTLPCPSIFGRRRPLAEATLRRIAAGIRRYVVDAGSPFIMPATHGRRGDGRVDLRVHSIDEPVRTITAANRGELVLVEPFIVRHGHYSTRTGAGLRLGCGAGTFRGQPLELPLATVCATNDKHLVCPLVTKHYARQVGQDVRRPLGTVTARDHHSLTAAFLTSCGADRGRVTDVRAFLLKYYGAEGRPSAQTTFEPLHTVTTRARFGLVTIAGEEYAIADIGMRMLQPHELFAAQGFPAAYDIAPEHNGRPLTKTAQIALAGNSVCPPVARAIVAEAGWAA